MDTEPDRLLMTPGPTALPPSVREAMSRQLRNPDVEPEFTDFYRTLLSKLGDAYGTDDDVLVLGGEGMLGLEAAVSSLVDPGDEVLCLANGLFGEGFADLVETHGGVPVVHRGDPRNGFDPAAVESLVDDREFVVATMVHCETPTGLLNDLDGVLDVLSDAGILSIVDAVSSLGGTPVPVDRIDVCLGASQKCFSSPPGLSTLSVSDAAWARVRATEQDSFYASLEPWREIDLSAGDALAGEGATHAGEEAVLLPYTHLVSNLYALDASLDLLLEAGPEAVYARHEAAAERCRERGRDLGLATFPDEGRCSPTVTAFEVDGDAAEIRRRAAAEEGVVLATGLGERADDVLRVGHMGYAADGERVERTMDALAAVLEG
ncbi:MAG: alanine--glyoxylate aminotransferase family protein [Salinigranum sp.]